MVFISNMSDNQINTNQVQSVSTGGGGGGGGGGGSVKPVRLTNEDRIKQIRRYIVKRQAECMKINERFEEERKKHIDVQNELSNIEDEIEELQLELKYKKRLLKHKENECGNLKESTMKTRRELCEWWNDENHYGRTVLPFGRMIDLGEKIKILQTKDLIDKSNREFAVVAKENQKRMSKNTILTDISKLPEVIVDHIRGYIPYEIRNEMIEQTYKPVRKLVPKLDKIGLCEMIKRIYLEPTFFSTLSPSRVEENTQGQFAYKPEWRFDKKGNMKVRLLNAIVELKRSHPELLYKVFSTLAILIQPDKKYIGVYVIE